MRSSVVLPRGLAWCVAGVMLATAMAATAANAARPAAVEDAIAMVRIQYGATPEDEVAAISPDGTQAAFVTWRGDLARNTNLYELRLVDLQGQGKPHASRVLLSRDFPGERRDQTATPITQLRFVHGGKAITYLGLDDAGIAQGYLLDLASGQSTALTRHATAVRTFTTDDDGRLIAYSAVAFPQDGSAARMEEDGVFLWDTQVFPTLSKFGLVSPVLSRLDGWHAVRQYFLASGEQPKQFFDSRQSRPAQKLDLDDEKVAAAPTQSLADDAVLHFARLPASPDGKQLLLYPYQLSEKPVHAERYAYYQGNGMNEYARRTAPLIGVVDVVTGAITPLVDAPSPQFESHESGSPLWSPDGKSVIAYLLSSAQPTLPPAWVEVDLATRRVTPLGLAKQWRPVSWASDGKSLVLSHKAEQFGRLERNASGGWSALIPAGSVRGFNPYWSVSSDGQRVLGVRDGLSTAPELVSLDVATGQSRALTDLNPALKTLQLGEVVPYRWRTGTEEAADGFVIKPVGYQKGKRYPLVILLDDGTMRKEGEPFLFDGVWQISSHAAQMLAGQGFMVLYPREPRMRDVVETPEEGERMRRDTEAAVAQLDRDGLIDTARIGVSGWSRAGYYVSYLLIHSSIRFAAAVNTDGGASEYTDHMRPFTDEELKHITTPLMFQSHGIWSVVYHGAMADRLNAFNRPVDMLYFQSASHSTTRPQHRLRSLGSSIDWWRFWLMDKSDANPDKAAQYAHWRGLRERADKNTQGSK